LPLACVEPISARFELFCRQGFASAARLREL
jgi:hypothetical protein